MAKQLLNIGSAKFLSANENECFGNFPIPDTFLGLMSVSNIRSEILSIAALQIEI